LVASGDTTEGSPDGDVAEPEASIPVFAGTPAGSVDTGADCRGEAEAFRTLALSCFTELIRRINLGILAR
jgi:hypothetical protein